MLQVTKELLKEMTAIIVREVNPCKIILFGSHARGTARRDSDLDFLVVEDGPFSQVGWAKPHLAHVERCKRWAINPAHPTKSAYIVWFSGRYSPINYGKCLLGFSSRKHHQL